MGSDVFEELLKSDNKLLKELQNPGDHYKILYNLAKQFNLYKDFAEKEHVPIIKAIIEAKSQWQ